MKVVKGYKAIMILLIIVITATLFTSCGKNDTVSTEQGNTEIQRDTGYPLETDVTLTYWVSLNGNVSATAANLGDTPFGQALSEKTGIQIEYIHPAQGQESEQFNLMIASMDLPDIIESNWYNFKGGSERAINEKVIMPLNDLVDQYSPNFKKYIDDSSRSDIKRLLQTEKGNYYVYPFIREDEFLQTAYGPMMRKDWLDDLGLEIPQTIDDWEVALRAFKEQKDAEAPLSGQANWSSHNAIVGAYGIADDFYVDDNIVKYGPIEEGYRSFLTTLNSWYKEGLLDQNYGNVDGKILDANVLGDKTGATFGFLGSGMGKWITAYDYSKNSEFELVGVPYPVLKEGDRPQFGQKELPFIGIGAAITTACKEPAVAAKFLDFAYSEDGHNLYNFGIEEESYIMQDGYQTYTDTIMKSPEGLTINHAMARYFRSSYSGPFVQDKKYMEQYLATDQQKEAIGVWMDTDVDQHMLPLLSYTSVENDEMTNLMMDIKTHKDEMMLKFIIGVSPLEEYDSFIEELKNMGIERVIEIKQNALDRYYKN